MASTREERVQARLRGAQRREVKDVDFGLSFPAFPNPPAAGLPAVPPEDASQQDLQAPADGQPSSRGPSRPSSIEPTGMSNSRPKSLTVNDANTSAKRRKLDTDNTGSSSNRSRRSLPLAQPQDDIYAIPPDEEEDGSANSMGSLLVLADEPEAMEETIDQATEPKPAVLVTDSTATVLAGKKSGRQQDVMLAGELSNADPNGTLLEDSVAQDGQHGRVVPEAQGPEQEQPQSTRKRKRGLRLSRVSAETGPQTEAVEDASSGSVESELAPASMRRSKRISTEALTSDVTEEIDRATNETDNEEERTAAPSVSVPQRRSKRISIEEQASENTDESLQQIGPQNTGRGKQDAARLITARRRLQRTSIDKNISETTDDSIEEVEQAEAIDDDEAAARLKQNRGRRVSTGLSEANSSNASISVLSSVQKNKRGRVRNVPSPVRQSHPKKALSKKKTQRVEKQSKKNQVRSGSPIPVTVHRLTDGPIYDDDEEDADILNSRVPCAKRGGVNAVDVLSQICQEIIGAGLETLEERAAAADDIALRREYRTKSKAIESFGRELQTITLDNTFALEKRVREGQKKKLGLREEILRVRAEREQVALRMDAIRIKHEIDSKDAQEQQSINNTVYDIELAVERGKTLSHEEGNDKIGVELQLKRLAGEVSSKSDTGGILKQIKTFNAFLERAALALEARK